MPERFAWTKYQPCTGNWHPVAWSCFISCGPFYTKNKNIDFNRPLQKEPLQADNLPAWSGSFCFISAIHLQTHSCTIIPIACKKYTAPIIGEKQHAFLLSSLIYPLTKTSELSTASVARLSWPLTSSACYFRKIQSAIIMGKHILKRYNPSNTIILNHWFYLTFRKWKSQ